MKVTVETVLGRLCVVFEDGAVVSLDWGGPVHAAKDQMAQAAAQQLADYFDGALTKFDLPLAPGGSEFQLKFYDVLLAIPYGETRTYGDISGELGVSAQAIGQACGANPIPVIIPCHRVLAANGLGGYSGAGGVEAKVALLKLEGAASLLI